MKINLSTHYAIEVLLFATIHSNRLVKIKEVAKACSISENHLMKIVNSLKRNGYLETIRGRNGGFYLAKPPEMINIGEIIMLYEKMTYLKNIPTFNNDNNSSIDQTLDKAYLALFEYLESVTLDQMVYIESK